MTEATAGNRSRRRLGAGFLGLAVVTYALLVFGSTVRVHGAGLACPDWPLCFGEVIPRMDFRIFLEWGHRVLAGGVSLGLLALGWGIVSRADLRREVGLHLGVVVVVLLVQVVLGGLTVLKLLAFWSVTLHLLCGNAIMVGLVTLGLRLRGAPAAAPSPRLGLPALLVSAAVAVQLALGGLVSSNYAGMACTEWPTCNGGVWFPTFTGIVGLQLVHRLGAYTVLAAALFFAWRARGTASWPDARRILGLVLVQVVVGVLNVVMVMPAELAVLHAALAHLIVGSTAVAAWRLWPGRSPARVSAGQPVGA